MNEDVRGPIAVLLLAHGSPESPEQVPEFLMNVTGGRSLPQHVIEEVRNRYQEIGTSPLTTITFRQGELLSSKLHMPVYVAMRNWHPFVTDTLQRMIADGVHHAVVICLAPQNSRTSVGLYRASLRTNEEARLSFDFVDSWHDQQHLIKAFAEKLQAAMSEIRCEMGEAVPVIFTAHSVPERTIAEGDPYETQARQTAELVAQAADLPNGGWRFAFQSQGMSGGAWLGPTVEATITDLKNSGHKGVLIQSIGFLCDHVEILYDIDIVFKQFAEREGMRLWRSESLNTSSLLISALAEVAQSRLITHKPA